MVYEMTGKEVGEALGAWAAEHNIPTTMPGTTFQWVMTQTPDGMDVRMRITTPEPPPR